MNMNPSLALDDERFHDLLADYLRRVDAGEEVSQAAFMSAHPEYAEALARYFEGASDVEEMAGPAAGEFARKAEFDAKATVNKMVAETSVDRLPSGSVAQKLAEAGSFRHENAEADNSRPEKSRMFGRYQILKALGQGAMGAVYLARDTQLDRQVALKIPKFSADDSADMLARFYREARAAAMLRHTNICPVFDVGEIDGQHYITMAFIEGRPLKDFARAKKLQPERQVASVIRKLALGLAEAHAHGVIHRDLKPANIMVDGKGEPVVMDFGLARRDEGDDRHVTRSGAILGTPAYMSPEQVAGDQANIGPPADVYSLGVVMYELLTGQVPFSGPLMSILMQIASEQPKAPTALRPGLDSRLEAICLKMMAKKAAERYGSMTEVAQALSEYLKAPSRVGSAHQDDASNLSVGNALRGVPSDSIDGSAANRLQDVALERSQPIEESHTIVRSHPPALPAKRSADETPSIVARPTPRRAVELSNEPPAVVTTAPPSQIKVFTTSTSSGRARRPILRKIPPAALVAIGGALGGIVLLFAAITLYVRLGKVDVKIVVRDENLAVKFGKDTITFEGSGSLIRVKPGENKFIVERDGLEAETDSFLVKKEGKNVIEVSIVDGRLVVTKDGHKSLERREPDPGPGGGTAAANSGGLSPSQILTSPDWEWTDPENLGPGVNTKGKESSPSLTKDERTIVFIREDNIWMSHRKSLDEPFGAAEKIPPPINKRDIAYAVSISGDGLSLAFSSNRGKNPGGDIFLSERASLQAVFSEPLRLPSPVNSGQPERAPQLSNDGLALIVASGRKPGHGLSDLIRFTRKSRSEPFGNEENLGPVVNSPRYNVGGAMSSDGLVMFRTRLEQIEDERAGDDAVELLTRASISEPFQKAMPLGPPFDRQGPRIVVVSPDGRRLYYQSKRPGGRGGYDLWMSRRVPKQSARPTAQPAEAGFVRLFNDSDLTGWELHNCRTIEWKNEKGLITGHNQSNQVNTGGSIFSKQQYKDFHFRCEMRSDPPNISMIYFRNSRSNAQGARRGYMVINPKLDSPPVADGWGIGAIYADDFQTPPAQSRLAPSSLKDLGIKPRDWYRLEFIARGENVEAWINGTKTASYSSKDAALNRAGALGIACQVSGHVEIRNVEIKDLSDAGQTSATSPTWTGWPKDAPPPAVAPFDATQAKEHQAAWAKHLGVPVEWENSLKMKFQLIPPGEFLMGSTPEENALADKEFAREPIHYTPKWKELLKTTLPQHKVVLTQPFYLGMHEVTQAEYEKLMGKNPSFCCKTGAEAHTVAKVAGLDTSNHPVDGVSWNDAMAFCAKLSGNENFSPFDEQLNKGNGYRLPTEAEWEFACRAGTATRFYTGDSESSVLEAAWCRPRADLRTYPIGQLKPNAFNLFDMHGNVYEWNFDWWDPLYYEQFATQAAIDPRGGSSARGERIVRGGNWLNPEHYCRSSIRNSVAPAKVLNRIGFRVALTVDAVKQASKTEAGKPAWTGWPKDAPPPAIAPFNAIKANEYQAAWAKHLGVPVEWENSIGMKFRLIPPGEFEMGSTQEEIDKARQRRTSIPHEQESIRSEGPKHTVVLTQPFYLGIHEVTQRNYVAVMGKNPSRFALDERRKKLLAGLDLDNFPVDSESWYDAVEFCAKLSQHEKLKPFHARSGNTVTPLEGTGYRLPSEAQWEFASRAGTTTKHWVGDNDDDIAKVEWITVSSGGRIHSVGELNGNPFGLHDVSGNVWEWVHDPWEQTYYNSFLKVSAVDPWGPTAAGSWRVLKGGGHFENEPFSRVSYREFAEPTTSWYNIGFRVSLPLSAAVRDRIRQNPSGAEKPAPIGNTQGQSETIDLLKLVDVNRDAVKGKWTLTAVGLASDGTVPFCRLKFPYKPPAEYDYRVEFTAQGGNDILQLLTDNGHDFTWLMGAWGAKHDGFDQVKGHPLARDGQGIIGGPTSIRRGQRHTSVIEVRKDSITAKIDGKLIVRHVTDGSDLGMPREWSIGAGAIGLGTTFDAVVFHKAEIIPLK